jgi:hypothetical protein
MCTFAAVAKPLELEYVGVQVKQKGYFKECESGEES